MMICSLIHIGCRSCLFFFFFNDPATTGIYTLSLHDTLPISRQDPGRLGIDEDLARARDARQRDGRSEEHTSELQSPYDLVCRLLLEKKKKTNQTNHNDLNDTILHGKSPLHTA